MDKENVDKRSFWRYVNKKTGNKIHAAHVLSVINILFEELISDLKEDKEIKIHNFGTLSLVKIAPRMYHNWVHDKIMYSSGNRRLSLKFSNKFSKKILKNLDLDKTFGEIK